jgi:HK97 family phage prohead protease
MERRFTNFGGKVSVEQRDGESPRLTGVAAVFYREGDSTTEYQLSKNVVERIDRDAFTGAINRRDDARALFNHDPNHLLGRVSADTLRLSVDSEGLRYEIDLPNTRSGEDVQESVKRGDLSGSSFAFVVDKADWTEENGRDVRTIRSVKLFDVGPVTYPAYEGTSTALRSEGDASDAIAELENHKKAEREKVRKRVRARLLEVV